MGFSTSALFPAFLCALFCREPWQWWLTGRHVIRKRPRRTDGETTLCVSVGGRCYDVNGVWAARGEKTGTTRGDPIDHPGSSAQGDDRTGPGERHDGHVGRRRQRRGGEKQDRRRRRVGRVCLGSCCLGVARQEEKGWRRGGGEGLTGVPSWGGGEVSRA